MSVAKKNPDGFQKMDWIIEMNRVAAVQRATTAYIDRFVGMFFAFVIGFTFCNMLQAFYQWLTP